eukprot:5575997-Pyramimonas_sp.AAC.1
MRPPPLRPSVEEHPMGPRNAVLGVADACAPPPLGPSVEPPYGATKRCAGCGGRMRPPTHWGLRWSSLWGHETLCW